jgi:hypothetical protein
MVDGRQVALRVGEGHKFAMDQIPVAGQVAEVRQPKAAEQIIGLVDGAVANADDDPCPDGMVVAVVELVGCATGISGTLYRSPEDAWLDFMKMIDLLNKREVSFVSVT